MRRLTLAITTLSVFLTCVSGGWADPGTKRRVLVGAYLARLATGLEKGMWDLDNGDFKIDVVKNKLWAIYLPARSPSKKGEPAPAGVIIWKCVSSKTELEAVTVTVTDFELLRKVAMGRMVALPMGPTEPKGDVDVEVLAVTTPGSSRIEIIPAVYKEVAEEVCVLPEQVRRVPVPPVFETVNEQVLVRPARTEWRRVPCEPHGLQAGEVQGDCWMLCEIPPVYRTCTKQVCVQPASWKTEIVPAQYETRTKTVMVQPEQETEVGIPPQFATVPRRVTLERGRRAAALHLGEAFGEILGLYFLPEALAAGQERVPATTVARWDDGTQRPESPWFDLNDPTAGQTDWSRLAESTAISGYLYVRGTEGAWGPQPYSLEARKAIWIAYPARALGP